MSPGPPPTGMSKKLVLGVLIASLLAAGGVAYAVVPGGGHTTPRVGGPIPSTTTTAPTGGHTVLSGGDRPKPAKPTIQLVSYGGCSDLLNQVKTEATREIGPYGFANQGGVMKYATAGGVSNGYDAAPVAQSAPGMAAASSGAVASGATATLNAPAAPPSSYSGTNNQEVGVDEPDVVKTDGSLLLVLRHQPMGLEVTDVSGSSPQLDGFLALPGLGGSNEMFLTGQYAVVLGQSQWASPSIEPPVPAPGPLPNQSGGATRSAIATPVYQQPSTSAVVISLADPHHPVVVRTFDLQGSEAGARLIAGRIVVVLQGQPSLPFVTPIDGSATSTSAATAQNQAVVAGSTVSDWLPSVSVSPGGTTWRAACQTAVHPSVPSGLNTVSIVSLDPSSSVPGPEVTAVGNATTVYASTTSLYVATTSWAEQMNAFNNPSITMPSATTDIHEFDLTDPTHPKYVASGWVPGSLIGQYALSEYQGVLRVATTVGSASPAPGEGSAPVVLSDNRVVTMQADGTALTPIGSIGGLGHGEKIYGVRFVGPLGYVVTFRQIDPLYILDLSSPTHPTLDGQLELTGFSSFLQPLDGGLMLGVGQGADPNMRQTGLQLSVFDVSHPNAPALRSRVNLGGASSPAENDPHALLWWPASRILAIPLSDYQNNFYGVGVWHIDTNGTLHQVARLAQPQPAPSQPCGGCYGGPGVEGGMAAGGATAICNCFGSVQRAVVIGNLLYTTSENGIMANNMTSWNDVAWLAFS